MNDVKKNSNRKVFPKIALGLAACLILAVGVFSGNYYSENLKVDSIVNIDVNPSIELTTNRQEKVLEVEALNPDAEKIIGDMELKRVDVNVAINALVGSMVKEGYIGEGKGEILVTVQNKNAERAESLKKEINADLKESLKENKASAEIINQTISKPENEAKALAEKHSISVGKATLILKLQSKDASLKAEDLAKLSLNELAALIENKKLDISDFAEFEADETTLENIEEEIEEVDEEIAEQVEKPKPNAAAKITREEAKKIALAHAGVKEKNAVALKAEYDIDDGIASYEVSFKSEGYEYDYDINAETGKIVKSEKEIDDDRPATVKPNKPTTSKPTASKPAATGRISRAKAIDIALAHAGVKEKNAVELEAERDIDDGIDSYEVSFKSEGYEYDYDINAKTGKIIKSEKDKDDDYRPAQTTVSKKPTTTQKISKSEAIKAAKAHAGVGNEATRESAELDRENGKLIYEVEFEVGNTEYSYEINAETGKVISFEKEIDD